MWAKIEMKWGKKKSNQSVGPGGKYKIAEGAWGPLSLPSKKNKKEKTIEPPSDCHRRLKKKRKVPVSKEKKADQKKGKGNQTA